MAEHQIRTMTCFIATKCAVNREPSHRGVCAQNLQTRGLKNDDDATLVLIFCAGHVGIYQINWL